MTDALPRLAPLVAPQPRGVEWPTRRWPQGVAPDGVRELVDRAFEDPRLATSYAVVVVQAGRLVAERYGNALPSFTAAPTPVTPDTALLSWSMVKSVLHAAVGIAVGERLLDPDAPLAAPEWPSGDPRLGITLRHALQMRDGLDWVEDYEDEGVSDVMAMLFGRGESDVAAFAANRPLAHEPGRRFNYSSGTSNLVARALGTAVGRGKSTTAFLGRRLFEPLGMRDATVRLDGAGTFVGSTFLYCSARSFAKFAMLYLRGGEWEGSRLLAREWTDEAQTPTAQDAEPATYYANHWWLDAAGTYWASGYRGQRARVVPDADAIVVRFGDTPAERYAELRAWSDSMVAALR